MYTREQIEQYIWDYIDGLSTPEDKAMVEKLLYADPVWRKLFEELSQVNQGIHQADLLDQPSMRFTKDVMDEVAKLKVAPPAQSYINKKIIYGIAAFFVLAFVLILSLGISQIDFSSGPAGSTWSPDLSNWSFNPSAYINSTILNIFMFFNVVAGLALLDHYLKKNRQKKA